eukprot:SAG22_NODE_1190_length_5206_cov_1.878990_6_plen_104_part_00
MACRQGAIVREEAFCANGDVTFGCGSPGGGVCSDGSKCKPAGVTGYGGDGHDASANSPLPGLMMSLAQFKALGVPANRVVMVRYLCCLHDDARSAVLARAALL